MFRFASIAAAAIAFLGSSALAQPAAEHPRRALDRGRFLRTDVGGRMRAAAGAWLNGRAPDSGSGGSRFESWRASQLPQGRTRPRALSPVVERFLLYLHTTGVPWEALRSGPGGRRTLRCGD